MFLFFEPVRLKMSFFFLNIKHLLNKRTGSEKEPKSETCKQQAVREFPAVAPL